MDGGEEIPVLDEPKPAHFGAWTLWRNTILFLQRPDEKARWSLRLFDPNTRRITEIASMDPETDFAAGFGVSPDGRWVLLSWGEPENSRPDAG